MESIEKFVAKRDLTLVRKDTFHVSKYKRQSRLLEVSNENYLQKLLKQ